MPVTPVAFVLASFASLSSGLAFSGSLPALSVGAAPSQRAAQAAPAAPAAAGDVVWSTPYQLTSTSACLASGCILYFALVGAHQRLDIQFVSCEVAGATGFRVDLLSLGVGDANLKPRHFLQGFHHDSGTKTYFVVSNPLVFSIPAGKRPNIKFGFTGTLELDPECTVAGVLNGVS